jgi:PST family polysaccharide transporter
VYELKRKTVSGIKWVTLSGVTIRILSTLTTIVLARLLIPADFGMFALAMVMIDGFGVFKSLGFDTAMVRRDENVSKAANTAFFLIPAMGMFLFLILLIVAPLGAKFLGNPSIANIIRTLGFLFVISCFGKVPQTILYREMMFKYKAIAEVTSQIIFSVVVIVLAFNKFGVWSMVIAFLLKIFIQVTIEWYFSGWKPKFEFDRKIAWEMFHFGKYVMASSVALFLYSNLDNITVGKLLGVTALGYYAIGRNLSNLLVGIFLNKVSMIMFPAYSKIQNDTEDLKRVMLRGLKYISIIALPFSVILLLFSADILKILFGEKWLPAVSIVQVLAFAGLFNCLGTAIWPIFLARGKSKADFQVNALQAGLFFILVFPLASSFKLFGVGLAVLISTIVSFSIGIIRVKRIIGLRIPSLFESIKHSLLATSLMLLVILLLKSIILTKFAYFNLILIMSGATLFYFSVIYFMNKNILEEIKVALIS